MTNTTKTYYYSRTAGQIVASPSKGNSPIQVGDKVRVHPNGYTPVVVEVLAVRWVSSTDHFEISTQRGVMDFVWQVAGGIQTVEQYQANRYSGYDICKN